MFSPCFSCITAILLANAIYLSASGAWSQPHEKASWIRLLAASTLVRNTWSQNENTSLALLLSPKESKSKFVRLVEACPNEAPPFFHAVMTFNSRTALRVRCIANCDRPFGEILLRTAPGHPMVILPEQLSFQSRLDQFQNRASIVPPTERSDYETRICIRQF